MRKAENVNAPLLGGWIIGAAAGLVAFGVAVVVGKFDLFPAGFIAAVIAVVVGLVLGMPRPKVSASPLGGATGMMPAAKAVPMATPVAPPVMASAAAPMPAAMAQPAAFVAAPAVAAPVAKPAPKPKTAKAPAAKAPAPPAAKAVKAASAKAATPAAAKAATPPAAKAAIPPVAKAAALPAAKAPAAKAAAKPKPVKAKPAGPVRLTGPRKGRADDLKEIEGIGPAMEKLVNGMGFYHFDQIASWSDADLAMVDAEMKTFKGRIARDKWVAQAKIIVADGLDAFRIRAKTNDY